MRGKLDKNEDMEKIVWDRVEPVSLQKAFGGWVTSSLSVFYVVSKSQCSAEFINNFKVYSIIK